MRKRIILLFIFSIGFFLFLVSCDKEAPSKSSTSTVEIPTTVVPTTTIEPTTTSTQVNPTTSSTTTASTTTTTTTKQDVYYNAIFKDYDGTVLSTQRVKEGETPSYSKSNPTRLNDDNYKYTFKGWNPTLIAISSDTTYIAQYDRTELPYTITFNLDGGSCPGGISTIKIDSLDKNKFKFNLTRDKYKFKGWSYNNTQIFDDEGNIVNNIQLESNMQFDAMWEENITLTITYALYNPKTGDRIQTYNTKPSDMGSVSETRSYHWNTPVDLFANLNEGYTFVGWYYKGTALSNEGNYNYMMWDEDVNIEARFQYTQYDLNVWSNNTSLGQVTIKNGSSQNWYDNQEQKQYYTESTTIAAYTKSDVRFLGWYNEDNKLVATNAVYTFNMNNRNYKLEAKWNYFDITYDLDGGTNNSNNPTYYDIDMENIPLLIPEKEGYTFQGWEYNNEIITEISTANLCHMRLKALWTYYALTTTVNNASAGSVTSYNNTYIIAGRQITIEATTNPGYTFEGWFVGDEFINSQETYTFNMPSESITYIAKWTTDTDTPYKVEHYLQNIDDNNYPETPSEIDYLTGTTDTQTAGRVKAYEGFTLPTISQVNIDGNGQTVIKLYYKRNSYSVTLNRDYASCGNVSGAGTYKYGKEITITASTNSGCTFVGWYLEDEQITNELTYTFTISSENKTYEARWIKVTIIWCNISSSYVGYLDGQYKVGDNVTISAGRIASNGTFTGWYLGDEQVTSKLTYTFKMPSDFVTYKAIWIKNPVTLTTNNTSAGTISIGEYRVLGENVTINANTNPGYTFNGWYEGNERLSQDSSYVFIMPSADVTYTAKWTANPDTPYKVEHYQLNIEDNKYTLYETDNLTGTTNTLTKGNVKAYDGFTSPEITQVNIDGDGSTLIKLYYRRNAYTVSVNKNIDKAGTISGSGTYKYGKKITISAQTNLGYTFNGWYSKDALYTEEETFDYVVEALPKTFEARYTINQYTITIDNQIEGVTYSGITSGSKYDFDSHISIILSYSSDKYLIWFFNDVPTTFGDSYSFNLPARNLTIKFALSDKLDSYTRYENKIYFGSYPQTRVAEDILITELDSLAGELPTSDNKYKWIDYNYYISSSITSYMFYQDIDYDNNGTYDYRGVYFTSYRPISLENEGTIGDSYQYNSGYTTNTIYWFKYEPIEWNIISETNGSALVYANLILDSQEYYSSKIANQFDHNGGIGYANNYELSYIRKWLNETFYNSAFNNIEKSTIKTIKVDNSAKSTGTESNQYACNNTDDKLFLFSYEEATTYFINDELRQISGTDYAKSQGLSVSSNNGFSIGWLRSPGNNLGMGAYRFYVVGDIRSDYVSDTCVGVLPVCWINL